MIRSVSEREVGVRGAYGSMVTVQRLGAGATGFFRISKDEWTPSRPGRGELRGSQVCIEALLDRQTFVALRVFVGTPCGPS